MSVNQRFVVSISMQAMSPVNGERYSRDGEKAIKRESSRSPCHDVSSRGSVASSSGKHKVMLRFSYLYLIGHQLVYID